MRHAGLRSPPFSRAPPSHGCGCWWWGEEVEGVGGWRDDLFGCVMCLVSGVRGIEP
jgi:hypothetical protein